MDLVTLVVTRPEPGAARTVARLVANGFDARALPLTEIVDLDTSIDAEDAAALIATSTAAFRSDAVRRLASRDVAVYVVGGRSAEAARQCGFRDIREGGGDAAGLARRIIAERDERPSGRLTYLAGRVRSPTLEEALAASGMHPRVVELYDTRSVRPDERAIGETFAGTRTTVLFYSRQAVDSFFAHVAPRLDPARLPLPAICLSARIAARLPAEWHRRAVVSGSPDEAALLALLTRLRNQSK